MLLGKRVRTSPPPVSTTDSEEETEEPRRYISLNGVTTKKLLLDEKDEAPVNTISVASKREDSLEHKDDCTRVCQYSETDLHVLDVSCENNWQLTEISDVLEILHVGTSQGYCLPESRLVDLLDLAVDRLKINQKLFHFLLMDLKYREPDSPGYVVLNRLLETALEGLKTVTRDTTLTSISSKPEFLSLQLTLHYVIEALLKDIQVTNIEGKISFKIEKLLSRPVLKVVVTLLSTLNHFLVEQVSSCVGTVTELHQDIQKFVCLPVLLSPTKLEEVICLLVEELGQMDSMNERMTMLQCLPSDVLLERVIDLHLEKCFPLHMSAERLANTALYQCSKSSLSKFCCVHLCRIPSKEAGAGKLSYLLFLLCSLLKALLLRLTGSPPVSIPSLTMNRLESEDNSFNLMEFQGMLASVKSHIPHFIDRLMEDAVVSEEIVQPQCWHYLQLLGNLPDMLFKT